MFFSKKYHIVITALILTMFFETENVSGENPASSDDATQWDFDIKELEVSYDENGFWEDIATIKLSIINDSNQIASSDIHINLFSGGKRVTASNPELEIYHLKDMMPGETIIRQITISDFDLSQFDALNVNITPPSQTYIFASELVRLDEFRPEKNDDPFLTVGIIVGIIFLIMTLIAFIVRNWNLESFLPGFYVIPLFFGVGHIFGLPQLASSLFFESLGLSFDWLAQEMAFLGIICGVGFALWLHIQLVGKLGKITVSGRSLKSLLRTWKNKTDHMGNK